ncbi:peptidoglycan-binding protein [Streptomyces longwoodensis]|uniref:peptidoglycan-binding protein n=1 Tax=Streptomyces longwoodensis TaxID=68231 RepID=UPI0022512565|nr:peptidoglycan-binding protein [Streptomyces longwoodensis]MCX5000456.1 peptidoglycan-binding protein [Streptomyces longwoodensis]
MPRSKALPAELDPHAQQLVTGLRRLKDRDELTLRHLAAKTGYSAKSWERYLGGTSLPPREAVEALARITGADPAPLLALQEIAADSWDSRRGRPSGEAPPVEQDAEGEAAEPGAVDGTEAVREGEQESPGRPTAPPPAVPARFPHLAITAGLAVLVVALGTALLLVLLLDDDAAPRHVATAPSSTAASTPPAYTCHLTRVDGRWAAGLNQGRDTEIGYGATGADVAEAQCLLRRAGISPGGIDGMFGPLTLRAVKRFQARAGLVADGMLGPRSWKALRG